MVFTPRLLQIKRKFGDLPVSRKLTVIMTASTAVALLFSGIGLMAIDSVLFRGYLQRDLGALARVVSENSTAALVFDDASSAHETLSALRAKTHVVAACIYRQNGTTLARYIRPGSVSECPPARDRDGIQTTGDGLTLSHAVILKGQRIGTFMLSYDLAEISARVKLYGVAVFGVLVAASLVAFLLSSNLQVLITDPISSLVQTATAVSRTNDYNIRAPELSDQELGLLGRAFNRMLEGIQSREVELRAALLAQENALSDAQNARDFLATTLASIGGAVIATDVEGNIVLANRAAQMLLRRPESEILGQHLNDVFRIVDEFTRETIDNFVTKVLRDDAMVGLSNHLILLAEDGTETPIDDSGAPIRGKSGVIQGAVLVFRDVTARRRG
jgi:PAS domain S-box-containing protein